MTESDDGRRRYERTEDLPEEEVGPYNEEQRRAFLATYNSSLEQFGDEARALEVAHAAAKGTPGDR